MGRSFMPYLCCNPYLSRSFFSYSTFIPTQRLVILAVTLVRSNPYELLETKVRCALGRWPAGTAFALLALLLENGTEYFHEGLISGPNPAKVQEAEKHRDQEGAFL
jgi:hypothetical protein